MSKGNHDVIQDLGKLVHYISYLSISVTTTLLIKLFSLVNLNNSVLDMLLLNRYGTNVAQHSNNGNLKQLNRNYSLKESQD